MTNAKVKTCAKCFRKRMDSMNHSNVLHRITYVKYDKILLTQVMKERLCLKGTNEIIIKNLFRTRNSLQTKICL